MYIDVPILILMDAEDAELASAYLELGAKGIITPFLESKIIVKAISLVFAGGVYVPPFFITWCINIIKEQNNMHYNSEGHSINGGCPKDTFTPRQWDVFNFICQGLPNKSIARNLNMQECSVKAHVRQLMKKLGAQNRTQIACIGAKMAER
jgi:DNA-binding NarL/FixJ family response regulator